MSRLANLAERFPDHAILLVRALVDREVRWLVECEIDASRRESARVPVTSALAMAFRRALRLPGGTP